MPLVDLDGIPQVALPFINQDHREEGRLLNELQGALSAHRAGGPREPVLERFEALLAHTRDHFGREEAAMQRAAFPPYVVHKAEHERVLEEMEAEGSRFVQAGDTERLWRYVSAAMPEWFLSHIQTMDYVSAQFVSAHGG
jgi:hemerythrin